MVETMDNNMKMSLGMGYDIVLMADKDAHSPCLQYLNSY